MSSLLKAYSGDNAVNYDAIRSSSPRWANEIKVMGEYLEMLQPKFLVDCPFGTGRWISQYDAIGANIIGVDLSPAMLDAARVKVTDPGRYTLIEKSIFDLSLPDPPDVVVCIRFMNWVSFDLVEKAFAALSCLGAQDMIIGCSVIPENTSFLGRCKMKASLATTNIRAHGKPNQYVHDEMMLRQLFSKYRWGVASKKFIFKNGSRENFFYHLIPTS